MSRLGASRASIGPPGLVIKTMLAANCTFRSRQAAEIVCAPDDRGGMRAGLCEQPGQGCFHRHLLPSSASLGVGLADWRVKPGKPDGRRKSYRAFAGHWRAPRQSRRPRFIAACLAVLHRDWRAAAAQQKINRRRVSSTVALTVARTRGSRPIAATTIVAGFLHRRTGTVGDRRLRSAGRGLVRPIRPQVQEGPRCFGQCRRPRTRVGS